MTGQANTLEFFSPAPLSAVCRYDSPFGALWLGASEAGLMHLVAGSGLEMLQKPNGDAERAAQCHLDNACGQLAEYFDGKLHTFNLALAPRGTEFQRQVWRALTEVSFGDTCSYSDIARQIARPKAVRAVGAANGANPIAIIVPCHRVIGKGGALTGYAWGLEMKSSLLSLESRQLPL